MKTDPDISYCGSELGERHWPDKKPEGTEWCPHCVAVVEGRELPGFREGAEEDLRVYVDDSRKPMTVEEVRELLTVCLHGPLPQKTVYRMMATLAEWMDLPEQLDKLSEVLGETRGALNANAKTLAKQTDLARQAEIERDEANRQLKQAREAADGCPLRNVENGHAECSAFPYENQAGGS